MAPEFLVVGERDKRGQHGLYERALSLPSLGSTFARYRGAPGSRCGSAPRAGSAGLKTKRMIVAVQQPRPPPGWAEPEQPSPNHDLSLATEYPVPADDQGAGIPRTRMARCSSGRSRQPKASNRSNRFQEAKRLPPRTLHGHNRHAIPKLDLEAAEGRPWRATGWQENVSRLKSTSDRPQVNADVGSNISSAINPTSEGAESTGCERKQNGYRTSSRSRHRLHTRVSGRARVVNPS